MGEIEGIRFLDVLLGTGEDREVSLEDGVIYPSIQECCCGGLRFGLDGVVVVEVASVGG